MARQNKPQEEEEAPGAPEWMVTFSDCMTLLLTFFVLLLSFSSFDNKEFSKLQVVFNSALDSIFPLRHNSRNSLNNFEPIKYLNDNEKGSEKPTDNDSRTEGLLNERLSSDLNDGVVLLLPSDKMFFSSASNALSVDGKNILNDIAAYLAEMPNRVVISERSPVYNEDTEYLRLQRAWEVMNYLVSKSASSKKIDKNRISISMSGTTLAEKEEDSARMIEISLLQRSIYN